jgi:hypothetical protein
MRGFDLSGFGHGPFRDRDDVANARRDQNSIPEPVVAGSECSADFGEKFGRTRSASGETSLHLGVAFFKQSE